MTSRPLRVAVVGAGPAGIYTADHLTAGGDDVVAGAVVDLLERLPVPFGLLRYGVAPDHVNIKATGAALMKVLSRPAVRLFAGVDVGRDVTVEELRERYDAVVYTVGASIDRRLGIPGEDLPGSVSATSYVAWYNGHPEGALPDLAQARAVAVIGMGNVALDVARILLRDPEDLSATDVTHDVLATLHRSTVTDVHLIGRRGPQHAKFTTKELRELGMLSDVAVLVDSRQVPAEAPSHAPKATTRNLEVLRAWAAEEPSQAKRRLHLHFGARPIEILGGDRVTGLRLEATSPEGLPTGRTWVLPVQSVMRSVGYRGSVLAGVPFDHTRFVIPSQHGRVLRGAQAAPGEYVAGWIKRGATGVLGTNRSDAKETVASIWEDAPALLAAHAQDPGGVAALIAEKRLRYVDLEGWHAIIAAEACHGAPRGRGEVKISDWDTLLEAALEAAGTAPSR